MRRSFLLVSIFAALKMALHLAAASTFPLHRDELLYLALGRHLDWGYWSNPPLIGAIAASSQTLLGDAAWATRLPGILAGGLLVWLAVQMTRELGGGRWAQIICGAAMLVSPAWLRVNSMLQPVPFDVLFWAALAWCQLRWINTRDPRWWWAIGAVAGVGMLNKYTLVFWAAGLLVALLLTPERRILATRWPWLAAMLGLLMLAPNLIWQWQYHFPVVHHMSELAENQLNNVRTADFLLDQLLMPGPGGLLIWLAGLGFLLWHPVARAYRSVGLFYVAIVLIFLVLRGKSYYTIGAYPVLFAAGGVAWERWLKKVWQRVVLVLLLLVLGVPLVPVGLQLLREEQAVRYFHTLTYDVGLDGPVRWEDGELHDLPQDFADMFGWQELAALVDTACQQAGCSEQNPCLVYGENYGQAAAIDHYLPAQSWRTVASFSDSYRLWATDSLPPNLHTFIYVNDELGDDVQAAFSSIEKVGEIKDPLAREKGTSVWLCRDSTDRFRVLWQQRVAEVQAVFQQ